MKTLFDLNDKWNLEKFGIEELKKINSFIEKKNAECVEVENKLQQPETIAEGIDLLKKALPETCKNCDIKFSSKFDKDEEITKYWFESDDLTQYDNTLKMIFKEVVVDCFGYNGVDYNFSPYDSYGKYKEKMNGEVECEVAVWFSIHYSYQHHDGGCNGMKIASVWFTKDGWKIKSVRK